MKNTTFLCGAVLSLALVAVIAGESTRARAQNVPPPLRPDGPSLGSNVNVQLTQDAQLTTNGGKITGFNGTLAQFSDSWVILQMPDSGKRIWIPTRHVAVVTQEAGALPQPNSGR